LTINVPRLPSSRSGEYQVTIRVKSQGDPEVGGSEEARWTVLSFSAMSVDIAPATVTTTRQARYNVTLHNQGNARMTYNITSKEEEEKLVRLFDPGDGSPKAELSVDVEPDQSAEVKLNVTAPRRWIGSTVSHGLSVEAESKGTKASKTARARFMHRALLPSWAAPFMLAALALLAWKIIPKIIPVPRQISVSPAPVEPKKQEQMARPGEGTEALAQQIQLKARQIVKLTKGDTVFTVALYAEDERLTDQFPCQSHAVAAYTGTYELVTMLGGRVIARTELKHRFKFDARSSPSNSVYKDRGFVFWGNWDVATFAITKPEGAFVMIKQFLYEDDLFSPELTEDERFKYCDWLRFHFYRIDDNGRFYPVMLISDGEPVDSAVVSAPIDLAVNEESVTVRSLQQDILQQYYRHYNGTPKAWHGKRLKYFYAYDGSRLLLTKTQDDSVYKRAPQ
jgi:hypothetical protein